MFIVPKYGQAALGVGDEGGPGLLLVHEGEQWTGPGFYTRGGITVGAEAGAAGDPSR